MGSTSYGTFIEIRKRILYGRRIFRQVYSEDSLGKIKKVLSLLQGETYLLEIW